MSDKKNPFPHENNTGHIWDDNIRELENPPPRWWMISFYLSIAWVIGYIIIYPALPIGNEPTKGLKGWTAIKEYKEDMAEMVAKRKPYEDSISKLSAKEILANEQLSNYVEASAKVLFGDNCAACHGNGGQGNEGFPVLADDDWLYGGTIEEIQKTISGGRKGNMPAHASILSGAEIDSLANSVIAGTETSNPLYISKGCIGCHLPSGKGMKMLGSANLTDSIYRFKAKDQLESVKRTIAHGVNQPNDKETREAIMPSFKDHLTKDEVKKLAVYVYKFGGGK